MTTMPHEFESRPRRAPSAFLRAGAMLALIIALCPSLCLSAPEAGHHPASESMPRHGDHGVPTADASLQPEAIAHAASAGCAGSICDDGVLKGLAPALTVAVQSIVAPALAPSTLPLEAVPASASGWPKFPSGVSPPRAL